MQASPPRVRSTPAPTRSRSLPMGFLLKTYPCKDPCGRPAGNRRSMLPLLSATLSTPGLLNCPATAQTGFAPCPHLEYNKHTTSSNQAGPAKFLPQAYGVDSRSCEHTYDPIGFINQVHPPLPGLTSFLPVAWLQGIPPSQVGAHDETKGRERGYSQGRMPYGHQLIFLLHILRLRPQE